MAAIQHQRRIDNKLVDKLIYLDSLQKEAITRLKSLEAEKKEKKEKTQDVDRYIIQRTIQDALTVIYNIIMHSNRLMISYLHINNNNKTEFVFILKTLQKTLFALFDTVDRTGAGDNYNNLSTILKYLYHYEELLELLKEEEAKNV